MPRFRASHLEGFVVKTSIMRFPVIFMLGFFSPALMWGENPFEQAARMREAARQKAFDRGQKTALPAAEKREKIAGQTDIRRSVSRSADSQIISQDAPSANVYNRVMEMGRYFKASKGALPNANDTHINTPAAAEMYDKEAERLYPELKKSDSAFSMRHAVISRWVDTRQPPLAKDSRRKLLIAHMVSLELKGHLREDEYHIGLNVATMPPITESPEFLKWNTFEITVNETKARLPDGQTGTFTAGVFGGSDCITWKHEGIEQTIKIPLASKGVSRLPGGKNKKYMRQETLKQGWRFTFLP